MGMSRIVISPDKCREIFQFLIIPALTHAPILTSSSADFKVGDTDEHNSLPLSIVFTLDPGQIGQGIEIICRDLFKKLRW